MADKPIKNTEGEKATTSTSQPPATTTTNKPGQRRRRPKGARPVQAPGDGSDPFAPKHLAAPGPVVNDPLADKCFFPAAGESLAQSSGEKYIYPGAEGLVPLATEEYTSLVAHTFSVKRSISLSGYCYYAACLTWARMLEVNGKNGGKLTYDERQFIDAMYKYKPPKILASYLAGFGNTDFPNGFHKLIFRVVKPTLAKSSATPYFPGWFGPIKDNARFYASYPCIAVFAKRIMSDLVATQTNEDDMAWDLPADFSYPGHALNEACIGYAPAQLLDRSIINTYSLCGITRNNFDIESDAFPVNYSLLNEIQLWIEEVRGLVQIPFPLGETGSRGQLLEEKISVVRNTLKSSSWQAYAPLRNPVGVEFAGSTFLYRTVKKYEGTGSQSIMTKFCPFEVAAFQQVPNDLNFLRVLETEELLHNESGISAEYTVGQRLRMFMSANIVLKT